MRCGGEEGDVEDANYLEGNGSNNASSASAGDVTAALKRTKDVMAQEIERVASVARVLGAFSPQSYDSLACASD